MSAARRGPEPVGLRLRRLMLMAPYLHERGDVPVAEVARRFGVSEAVVRADVALLSMCGLPPFLEELLEIYLDEDSLTVRVGLPRVFTRPMRLTPSEAAELLTACQAALTMQGAEPDGALGRAVAKLARMVGEVNITVALGRPPYADLLERAAAEHLALAVRYYSEGRDEVTDRVLHPLAVFVDEGRWYLLADCTTRGPERLFRVDRIEAAEPTGGTFPARRVTVPEHVDLAQADAPIVTLRLPADARWVVETYPVRAVRPQPDGGMEVDVVAVSERWLATLLLRAGAAASVLAPPELASVGVAAAQAVLDRYA